MEVHSGEPLKVDCISSVKDVSFVQGRPVNIIEDFNQVAEDNGSGMSIHDYRKEYSQNHSPMILTKM